METLKKVKNISIASLILSCVMGVIFIAFPAEVMAYISLFIGGAMIILGIAEIINFIVTRLSAFMLISGVFSVILGIVVWTKYEAIIKVIIVLLGVFLLTSGIVNFIAAIKVIISSFFIGWVTLFFSIATSVLGIVAITKAGAFSEGLVQFIGVALIVYSILEIFAFISIKAALKDVKEVVDDAADRINEAISIAEADDSEAIETTGSIVEDDNDVTVETEPEVIVEPETEVQAEVETEAEAEPKADNTDGE